MPSDMDFHFAIERGNLPEVRRMLRIGASLSTPDRHGNTPMHLAAVNGHMLIMAMIAERDVDLCAKNYEGQTPLHLAAVNGHSDGVQLLAEHIADTDRKRKVASNRWECKKLQIDLDENSDVSVREQIAIALREQSGLLANLFRQLDADETGDITKQEFCTGLRKQLGCDLAQAELEAVFDEFDPDGSGHVEYHEMQKALCSKRAAAAAAPANSEGATGDQEAVQTGNGGEGGSAPEGVGPSGPSAVSVSSKGPPHATAAPYFLAARWVTGQERNLLHKAMAVKDHSGWNPLHAAAANGHDKVLRLMIDFGVDLDARTQSQLTPLCLAAAKGHADTITLLAGAGAAVEAWDAQLGSMSVGQIPLHIAAVNAQEDALKHLLEANANLEARDQSGSTALHIASTKGLKNIVILLIGSKANLDAQNASRRTAVHLAAARGEAAVIAVLARAQASLEIVDVGGRHAIHLAAERGHVEAVRTLAELGSPLTGRDLSGETPLHLAAARAHIEVARELTKAGVPFESKSNVSQVRMMLKMGEYAAGAEVMEEWLERLEMAAKGPYKALTPRRNKVLAAPTVAQKAAKAGRRLLRRVREGHALARAELIELQELALAAEYAGDEEGPGEGESKSNSEAEEGAEEGAEKVQQPSGPRSKRASRTQPTRRVRAARGGADSPRGSEGVGGGGSSEHRPMPPLGPRPQHAPSPREGGLKASPREGGMKTPRLERKLSESQCAQMSSARRHAQRQWDSQVARPPPAVTVVDPRQIFAASRPRLPKMELLSMAYPSMSPSPRQPLSARAARRRPKPDPDQLPPIPHTQR